MAFVLYKVISELDFPRSSEKIFICFNKQFCVKTFSYVHVATAIKYLLCGK